MTEDTKKEPSPQTTIAQKILNLKVLTIISICSAQFGLGFQKGMLEKMGLGNISGNYSVQELLYSSIYGAAYILELASKVISNWKALFGDFWVFSIVAFIGSLIVFLIVCFKDPVKQFASNKGPGITNFFKNEKLLAIYLFFGAQIAYLFSKLVVFWLLMTLITVSILPFILGHKIGQYHVSEAINQPPCGKLTEEMLDKQDHVRECTHFSHKGNLLRGKIFLEKENAVIFQTNNAFLSLGKTGDRCIFSSYQESEEVNESIEEQIKDTGKSREELVGEYGYTDSQLSDFCKTD